MKTVFALIIAIAWTVPAFASHDYEKVNEYLLKETQQKQVVRILTVNQLKAKKERLEQQLAEVNEVLSTASDLGVKEQEITKVGV